MAGRSRFSAAEIAELRELIRSKQTADRSRQKTLRARMRRLGFYITDFADYSGFTVSDLDELIKRGTIVVAPEGEEAVPSGLAPAEPRVSIEARQAELADDADRWYDELRERYRPGQLRILLIAESPPDPGDGERRFFYSPRLSHDNLYRGVAEAVYGRSGVNLRDKRRVLELLQEDGFWLIDAVDQPVNKASAWVRREAIARAVPALVERVLDLAPERGVVICHAKVYELAAPSLRAAGVRILHDDALPFPLGNWRARFVSGLRQALESV
jgi:hypothetical protein